MSEWSDRHDTPALQKHSKLLQTLSSDRIFDVGYYPDENVYTVCECCDDYFYHDLTAEECRELSELFNEIADEMEDNTMAEWISVKDRLPEPGQDALLLRYACGDYFPDIGWWTGEEWEVFDNEAPPCCVATVGDVEYWLPIPEPPKDL